jgi:signal transduction histidine kinase
MRLSSVAVRPLLVAGLPPGVRAYCGRVRPDIPRSRNGAAYDAVAVAAAASLAVNLTVGPLPILQPHHGATVLGLVVIAGSLWWRRHAAAAVAWTAVAGSAAMLLMELLVPGMLLRPDSDVASTVLLVPTAPFAVYSVAAYATVRRRVAWLPVAALAVLAAVPWQPSVTHIRQSLILIGLPALLGVYLAARRRLLRVLAERAERAEREQHLLAEHARAEERTRLAAEMHDVVSHRVSLMILQTAALSLTAADDATRTAAEQVRATGCQAMEELHEIVTVLRTSNTLGEDAEPAVQEREPLPDLSTLITASASVGIPVDLVEEGPPTPVSPVVGRTAYRIVQEALTNVRKHAPGARVAVHLRHQTDGVHLTVRNTAATGSHDPALIAAGSGTGLSGLQQRVELIGGSLQTGPDPHGGFHIQAHLPTCAPAQPRRKALS